MVTDNNSWWQKLRKHHGLMMLLCCLLPLIIVVIVGYFWGFNRSYLFWVFLLLCPLTHYLMMRDLHEEHSSSHEDEGKKPSCH